MIRGAALTSLAARGTFELPDGRRAFVKLSSSRVGAAAAAIRRRFSCERVALQALAGLAVPALYRVELDEIPCLRKASGALRAGELGLLVSSYEGDPVHDHTRRHGSARMLGVWLFCLEQLVAFRRHQLLYTDLRCADIVARSAPDRAVIVGLDRVVPLVGKRSWQNFSASDGSRPPELRTADGPSEASCVYQLAILLVHLVTGGNNKTLADRRRGLRPFEAAMERVGAGGVAALVRRCVADLPGRRPRDYEAVLDEVRALALPATAARAWRRMRAPHQARLNEVGLCAAGGGSR